MKKTIFCFWLLTAFVGSCLFAQTMPSWYQIKNTPTTLEGYGITDALKGDLSNATETVSPVGAATLRKALKVNEGHVVDVTDFGAVPDDQHDDYAAFAAAISTLADGSTLRIPPGLFYTSESIHIGNRNDLIIECQGRIAPQGANVELVRITSGRGIIGTLRLGAFGASYGTQSSVVALGNLSNANLLLDFVGYSGAATQTVYLFTNPNSVLTINGTTHYCDNSGEIVISVGAEGLSGDIATEKLDKLHFSGDDLALMGNLHVASGVYATDLVVTDGNIQTNKWVNAGSMQVANTLNVTGDTFLYGDLEAGQSKAKVAKLEAASATITQLSLGYNNHLNIATATVNRLTSPAITAGDIAASGQMLSNSMVATSAIFDTLKAKSITASSTHYENLSAQQIIASAVGTISATASVFEAGEATIASAALSRLVVQEPIEAQSGMVVRAKANGPNISHESGTAQMRLATGTASISVAQEESPGTTAASIVLVSDGRIFLSGNLLNLAGISGLLFPLDVTIPRLLTVGNGLDIGEISTRLVRTNILEASVASIPQEIFTKKLSFLNSFFEPVSSFITAHSTTGALQFIASGSPVLIAGKIGTTINGDLAITGSITTSLEGDFGEIGSTWRVQGGGGLAVEKGGLRVYGLASAASLLTPQATIASATIERLEVGELIYDLPEKTATATAVLASSTASTTLPIAFSHPDYSHDRSLDSGIYSPAYGELAFWVDNPSAIRPWLKMTNTGGQLADSVATIYKSATANTGLSISAGTVTSGGNVYLGAPGDEFSAYCQIKNGSVMMIDTYGNSVRIGTVTFDDNYKFLVGGKSLFTSVVKVEQGINVAATSEPSPSGNGTIYYDPVSHKFRGRANGVWVDLH